MGFLLGVKNEFEIAVVNEPSVFEPLKFYCMILNTCFYSAISLYKELKKCYNTALSLFIFKKSYDDSSTFMVLPSRHMTSK